MMLVCHSSGIWQRKLDICTIDIDQVLKNEGPPFAAFLSSRLAWPCCMKAQSGRRKVQHKIKKKKKIIRLHKISWLSFAAETTLQDLKPKYSVFRQNISSNRLIWFKVSKRAMPKFEKGFMSHLKFKIKYWNIVPATIYPKAKQSIDLHRMKYHQCKQFKKKKKRSLKPSITWKKWDLRKEKKNQQIMLERYLISWGVINIHWDPWVSAKSTRVSKLIFRLTASWI